MSFAGSSKTNACNVCCSKTDLILSLSAVPPIQNRFYQDAPQARNAPLIDVAFWLCHECFHIGIQKETESSFDCHYNNDQSSSPVSTGHINEITRDVARECPQLDTRIVEIGCGRGELLVSLSGLGYSNIKGFDPVAPDWSADFVKPEYWHPDGTCTDLFILRHTLEEIPNPDGFVNGLFASLASNGRIYFEISNAQHIIRNLDIFSLYPEYSNLFSLLSLTTLLNRNGLSVERVVSYFEGEYLGVWVRAAASWISGITSVTLLQRLISLIRTLPGPVALWGAGGRGGNILSFLGADSSVIPLVVDLNEKKQGLAVPPYGQKIISSSQLEAHDPKTIIVSSEKYLSEIKCITPQGCLVISAKELITRAAGR